MRPLNRPMFKYGGPIKEGIMTGMKDGGSMGNNEGPRRAALVGNNVFPRTNGRENHLIQIPIGIGMGLARLAPLVMRGARAAQGIFGKRKFVKDVGTKLASSPNKFPFTPVKMGFEPNKLGAYLMNSPEFKFATGAGGKASKFVGGAIKGLAKSPLGLAVTAGTLTDVLPGGKPFGPDKYLPNLLGNRYDEEGNKIPGTGLFNPDKVAAGEGEGLKRVTEIGAEEKKVDPKVLKELNEDRIDRTKKRYYEIMGLDKMKKEAVYDSLINASQIIAQEGGDLKGSIKSGSLQNQIINAISKNLDKSADIKRQVDAAILKGEITKDINLTKPSAFEEQLAYIRANPNDPLAKKLSGQTSVADIVSAAVASGKGTTLTSDNIVNFIESKGYSSTALADDKYQKWAKSNENKDEIDYFIEKYSGADDGLYVVNKKAFIKKGNEIAPVSLDSLVG